MMEIRLTQGKVALIDAEDYALVAAHSWHAHNERGRWYARTRIVEDGKANVVGLHTILRAPPAGMMVDHRNRNGLDNRRVNLRVCSHGQNVLNRLKRHGRYSSDFIGIYRHRPTGRWTGQITSPTGKRVSIGYWDSEQDAARVRDRLAAQFHGEFAVLNESIGMFNTTKKDHRHG